MKLNSNVRFFDGLILSAFAILITFQPFFLHGKINLFEVGLYLPGIDAILNGQIPYRDFFHLRGPFELYMPALLMSLTKVHLSALYSYFYFGNVLCLILCVWIAKELFQTRYLLYLMVPVLVGRTWPRVVFTYWGGMRYAFGLLAMLFMIKFLKREKLFWMFLSGLATALGFFTSVEIGVYVIFGVGSSFLVSLFLRLQSKGLLGKAVGVYALGFLVVALPYAFYLWSQEAFFPYIDSFYTIVTRMQKVIDPHLVSIYPRNFLEAIVAMTNPVSKNFRHMTPSYLYLALLGYLFYRIRSQKMNKIDLAVLALGVYGFIMYNTGFRGIWASQFEMALQPEKILLFFLLEGVWLNFCSRKQNLLADLKDSPPTHWQDQRRWKVYLINFCFLGLFCSSVGYSIQRYNHRFFAFKYVRNILTGEDSSHLDPRSKIPSAHLTIPRAKGIAVPVEQAQELEAIDQFLQENTDPHEVVFTYPELGTYNFLSDRPCLGRFPLATFAWFNDQWHQELVEDFKTIKPRYVILAKKLPDDWYTVYLGQPENKLKYDEMMGLISSEYELKTSTRLSDIYQRK